MDDMKKELEGLKDILKREIRAINKKDDITPLELENMTKAVCLAEKIEELEERMAGKEYDGYSERMRKGTSNMYPTYPYYDGRDMDTSHRRTRSSVTGRFTSNDTYYDRDRRGYSGHSIHDRMIAKLEEMYDEAKTDHERNIVNKWIDRIGDTTE